MNNDPSASPGEKSLRSELGDFFVDANRLITDWGKFHKPVSLVAIDGPEGATANAIYGTLRRPADPQCYELYHYKYHDADRGTVKRTIAVSLGPSVKPKDLGKLYDTFAWFAERLETHLKSVPAAADDSSMQFFAALFAFAANDSELQKKCLRTGEGSQAIFIEDVVAVTQRLMEKLQADLDVFPPSESPPCTEGKNVRMKAEPLHVTIANMKVGQFLELSIPQGDARPDFIDDLVQTAYANIRATWREKHPDIRFELDVLVDGLVRDAGLRLARVKSMPMNLALHLLVEESPLTVGAVQVVEAVEGVAMFDAALWLEEDEAAAAALVKRMSDRKIRPRVIGKDPRDKRRNLSELSEILNIFTSDQGLDNAEKLRLRAYLRKQLRRIAT